MTGREKFDFVSTFWDTEVCSLNWGWFFNLVSAVKKDICRLLVVQERAKSTELGKTKRHGKKVSVDASTQDIQDNKDVHCIATDRDRRDVNNFYTQVVLKTRQGRY